jgi:DNA-binding response OmpR family regulator
VEPAAAERRATILVVEDESRIAHVLTNALASCAFETDHAPDGGTALRKLRKRAYDVVLLDLLLPGMDGFETLARIRALRPMQEVIALSSLSDAGSKVRCFELGASDYVSKPFALAELVARIRARIRLAARPDDGRYLRNHRLILDLHRHAAIKDTHTIRLSPREFFLLECLVRNEGKVCTREELLETVWGCSFDPGTNVVDVCIRRLRGKLGRDIVETVRSVGYCYGTSP